MTNFLQEFKTYKDCVPPGVRLPSIEIEDKYYKALGVPSDISTYDFLRKLCLQGVKDRGIDTKTKKEQEAYYARAKMELEVLRDLGFVDYILLNWDILNFCHENDIHLTTASSTFERQSGHLPCHHFLNAS